MILADFNPAILFLLLWGMLSWFTKKKKREARENITEDSGVKIEKEDIFTRLQKLQDHLAGEVEIFPKKSEEEEIEWEQEDIEEEPVLVQEPVVEYPIPDEKEWYKTPEAQKLDTYLLVNFIDGLRSILEIRNTLSAATQPVSLEVVDHFIRDLAKLRLVELEKDM